MQSFISVLNIMLLFHVHIINFTKINPVSLFVYYFIRTKFQGYSIDRKYVARQFGRVDQADRQYLELFW